MSEQELGKIRKLVFLRLRRWLRHPDFDDLFQEAMLAGWRAWERSRDRDLPVPLEQILHRAISAAVLDLGRSQRAYRGVRRAGLIPAPPIIAVEALARRVDEENEVLEPANFLPPTPDFAAALLDKLEAVAIWERWLPFLTARERQVLIAWIDWGWTHKEIAVWLDLHLNTVYKLAKSGLSRYRQAAGVPPGEHGSGALGSNGKGAARRPAFRSPEANRLYMREYRRRQQEKRPAPGEPGRATVSAREERQGGKE